MASSRKAVEQSQTRRARNQRIAHVLALNFFNLRELGAIDAEADSQAWNERSCHPHQLPADAVDLGHGIQGAAGGNDSFSPVQAVGGCQRHHDRAHAVSPDEQRQRRKSLAQRLADGLQVAGKICKVRDMRSFAGKPSVSLLVINETGNVPAERVGHMAVAIAVFGNAVHDHESGLRGGRHHLVAREMRSGQHAEFSFALHVVRCSVCSGGGRASSQIPASTSKVPTATHAVKGSPSSAAISMVESGPIAPVCAVSVAPIRSIAIITMSTGAKVHSVAFSTESHKTCGATAIAASGRSSRNCAMQMMQATDVASPVRRNAPSRCTSSPLYERYTA